MTRYIELHFSNENEVSLVSTRCSLDGKFTAELSCSRQKYSRFGRGEGSFTWTKGVQALCCALISYKIRSLLAGPSFTELRQPLLVGRRPSPASCLDDAIYKQPHWLLDMFGVDSNGRTRSRRIFVVENTGAKLPGPIKIGVNPHVLLPTDIYIFDEGGLVTSLEHVQNIRRSLQELLGEWGGKVDFKERPIPIAACG